MDVPRGKSAMPRFHFRQAMLGIAVRLVVSLKSNKRFN